MVEHARQLRIGLQFKAMIVMALIVVGGTVAAGWAYFLTVRTSMQQADQRYARQVARALSLAADHNLVEHNRAALQKLVGDFAVRDRVRYVSLQDEDGTVLARSMRGGEDWSLLSDRPLTVRQVEQIGPEALVVLWPVLSQQDASQVNGAVRLVLDTAETTAVLKRTQRRMGTIGIAVVLTLLPLAHLLVRRLLIRPVEQLAAATQRLSAGEADARAGISRSDEIGQLAAAFDTMAARIEAQRTELINANEQLEQKVSERTSELLEANDRLRETMADKDDFLRAVSHDLNAPLRNIAGISTMVMMKWRDDVPEEVLARLQRIVANVETETALIGELLELSRIKTQHHACKSVDLGQLASEVAGSLEYDLQSAGIDLVVAENLPTLWVDPNRLRQVLQNLIDNSVKYMDKSSGGRIEIGAARSEACWQLWVQDNGPGIPSNQRERVFHVFRRVEGPATAAIEGKGVGLAVVRSVAELYDGRAWVEETPGGGARFVLTLADEKTTEPARAQAAPAAA